MNKVQKEIIQKNILAQWKGTQVSPIALFGSPGLGKALPDSEQVLTPNGFVKNGTLKPGNFVIGSDGKPTKVLSIHPQPIQDIYRVSFFDETHIDCTLDHLWTVSSRAHTNRALRTLTLKDMLNKPIVKQRFDKRYGTTQNEYTYSIPYTPKCEFDAKDTLGIHPYIMGVLLGDGGLSAASAVNLTNGNKWLIEKVRKLLPKSNTLGKISYRNGAYHCSIIKNKGYKKSKVLETLKDLGLMKHKSIHKFIPSVYLNSSSYNREQLLQGLNDTDGHLLKGRIEYSSSSAALIEGYKTLSLSLGIKLGIMGIKEKPAYTYKGKKCYGNTSYRLVERTKRSKNKAIVSIEKLPTQEASTCITIASEDKLYVAGSGFNLTHNSSALRGIAEEQEAGILEVSIPAVDTHVLSGIPEFIEAPTMHQYQVVPNEKALGTTWSIPEMIQKVNLLAQKHDKAILLLDDVHRISISAMPYLYALLQDKTLGQYRLDKRVAIVLAGNDSEDAGFSGFDSAVVNRMGILKIAPDFDAWFDGYGKFLHFYVSSFLRTHSSYALEDEVTSIEGFGSFRAWTQLANEFEGHSLEFIQNHAEVLGQLKVSKAASIELAKHIAYIEAIDFSTMIKNKANIDINSLKPIEQILYAYCINYCVTVDDAAYIMSLIDSNIDSSNFIGFIVGELYTKYLLTEQGAHVNEGIKVIINKLFGDNYQSSSFTIAEQKKADGLVFKEYDAIMSIGSEFII